QAPDARAPRARTGRLRLPATNRLLRPAWQCAPVHPVPPRSTLPAQLSWCTRVEQPPRSLRLLDHRLVAPSFSLFCQPIKFSNNKISLFLKDIITQIIRAQITITINCKLKSK